MTKGEFTKEYIITYLATFAALNGALLDKEDLHPVAEAVLAAIAAWDALEDFEKG